ncbi:LysM peptidoglycan-binding domain-containing protein [Muribaculaceae bacterium Isolate-013 (NCI)]|nr:LysM peptidoglycan-binding domain-containing protein [Muribaculaceae bacterium Isolate-013 (NCI)]
MATLYNMIKRAAALVALTATLAASAQVQTLPTMGVAGRVLRYYDVRTGDSVYSVARDLGITVDQIIANNPSAADGLTPGMRLYFPESLAGGADATPAPGEPQHPLTHVVEKGESVYGISARYNIPVETIIKLNPQADSGVHAGQVLRLAEGAPQHEALAAAKPDVAAPKSGLAPRAGYEIYKIAAGETLFAIADSRGTTLDAIQVANPDFDITSYSEGDEIYVPLTGVRNDTAHNASPQTVAADMPEDSTANTAPAGYSSLHEMSVAVVLPFMAEDEHPGRAARLNQEFLRGFLMGVREHSDRNGAKIYVRAFDTKGNMDTLRMLMERPEVSGADIIVVPDADGQMAFIEDSDTRSVLLNYFSIKDETYRNHSNVVQANIPHDKMYDRAINGFMQTFRGEDGLFLPVFLSRADGPTDKAEFTRLLKERLDAEGVPYATVEYSGSLEVENLAGYTPDVQPAVYIPESGTRHEFLRYAPVLEKIKEELATPENMALWGYPEFVTFKGENRAALHSLNTTIYSRYYTNDNDYTLRSLRSRYKDLYGQEMTDAFPLQGVQGYDAAAYIVAALRGMAQGDSLPKDFEGAQGTLRLERAEGLPHSAGLVNNSLFLIHYREGNGVEKTRM